MSHDGGVAAVATTTVRGRPIGLSSGGDGLTRLWDLLSARQIGQLRGHDGWVLAVTATDAFGTPIAVTGGRDETVRVWNLDRAHQRGRPMNGHVGDVTSVAVGEIDGQPIAATGGADGTVRLWDLVAGRQRGASLEGHMGTIRTIALATVAGRPIAVSAGFDGTIRAWDLQIHRAIGDPLVTVDGINALHILGADGNRLDLIAAGIGIARCEVQLAEGLDPLRSAAAVAHSQRSGQLLRWAPRVVAMLLRKAARLRDGQRDHADTGA